jgi:YVTN family beta-propeller protein
VTTKKISIGDGPVDVAVAEGGVWVANSRDGTVSRIDPSRNAVVATIEAGNEPRRLALAEGMVWVSVQARAAGGGS